MIFLNYWVIVFCVCRNTEACPLSCYLSTHSVLKDGSLQRFFSFYLPKLTEVSEEFSGFLALRPTKGIISVVNKTRGSCMEEA